jgi:hypothetical protein
MSGLELCITLHVFWTVTGPAALHMAMPRHGSLGILFCEQVILIGELDLVLWQRIEAIGQLLPCLSGHCSLTFGLRQCDII